MLMRVWLILSLLWASLMIVGAAQDHDVFPEGIAMALVPWALKWMARWVWAGRRSISSNR
jgi:hypothetical protein